MQSFAQTTYRLELLAEGNFGTPNGDIFIRNTIVNPATNSTGAYQAANGTTGFDVLQDYKIAGNKVIFIEKPAGTGRIVIADHATFTEIHTFPTTEAPQTIGVVSSAKAYVSFGNPAGIVLVDLVANTLTPVTDTGNDISSHSDHMVYARGFMFAQIGGDIVKIDTATNAVTEVISPSVGSISGLVADDAQEKLWVMGGGTLKSIDLMNGDVVSAAITTGPTSSANVRYYDGHIYFWAGKDLFIYDIVSPVLPLTSVYTSALPGGSWSFGYGRSFDIDETTGDFVIATANDFSAPGYFEVVAGTAFTIIESTNLPGCAIPNNAVLKTYPDNTGLEEALFVVIMYPNPVNDVLHLVFEKAQNGCTITDLNGRTIYTFSTVEKTASLDVSAWTEGMYLLRSGGNAVRFAVVH